MAATSPLRMSPFVFAKTLLDGPGNMFPEGTLVSSALGWYADR